ncbi:MAG TPA: beta-galactosidase trimerization domain-containing protein, partial [Chloroflexota bacterium]|nr:beta-galactosidase trimerization domain-containing protein [Chloroflexota bacterium]
MSYSGEFFTFLEGGAREAAEDVDDIADLWDYQMACIFPLARTSHHSALLPVPVWRAEEQMKYLRATGSGNGASRSAEAVTAQTPVMLYGHFDNQSRYTTPAREEMRLWLAGMAAQGGSPWDCLFVGVPPSRWWDRRHQDVQEDSFAFLADHEADFAGVESVAEVGVVHSQRTQDRFASGQAAQDAYITHFRGWELALFAQHLQWDVVPPSQLRREVLERYRTIVLPNVACLSDGEAEVLRGYVERGGTLLATYETGCNNADGSRRSTGALDDVLGVRDLGLPPRGPLPHAYTRLRTRDGLTAGFEETEVITNEGYVREVGVGEGAQVHATLVPEIVPQPPDLSYPTLWENEGTLLVSNAYGRGRAVYFANQTDRLNVTSGHPDHQRLLENALVWALSDDPPIVMVEAGSPDDATEVHATLLRQPSSGNLYVHLVNYSGARGRPVRAPHALGPLTVTVQLAGFSPGRAEPLVSAGNAALNQSGGRTTITVPRLELYEVV